MFVVSRPLLKPLRTPQVFQNLEHHVLSLMEYLGLRSPHSRVQSFDGAGFVPIILTLILCIPYSDAQWQVWHVLNKP